MLFRSRYCSSALRHRLLRVLRPVSVILIFATSIVRPTIATRSAFVVASPAWTNSTICSAVKPRASRIASEQPSGLEASSSSARRRSGLGPRLGRSVGCLGYAGHNVDTAYSHRLIGALSPRALFHQCKPRLWRGASHENSSSCPRRVNPPPDTGLVAPSEPTGTVTPITQGPGTRDGRSGRKPQLVRYMRAARGGERAQRLGDYNAVAAMWATKRVWA